ncbi:ALMS1 centrosome and basal body associated protein isoform X2 [Amia ocellicauda]|uniref:ALMS1 centrosome and basal body associated protein isoform X2 n=1 Tax=Amia ocellicauda TaxID=2972642 RepID=UPI00346419BD
MEPRAEIDNRTIVTTPPASRLIQVEELRSQSSSPGSGTHLSSTSGVSLGEAIVQRAKQGMESWYQLPAEEDVSKLTETSVSRVGLAPLSAKEHAACDFPSIQEEVTMTGDTRLHQTEGWSHASPLEFQDSRLSPALPLLPVHSSKTQNMGDDTFYQQTEVEFAPLRESPDVSVMSARITRPLQISDAVQLVITEVSVEIPSDHPSLSQHPLAITTATAEDASSNCSLSQHTLSHMSLDEGISNFVKISEEEMEGYQLSGLKESQFEACVQTRGDSAGEQHASSVPDYQENLFKQLLEDEASFLSTDCPNPLLHELLEKDVGLAISGAFPYASGSSTKRTLSGNESQKDKAVNKDQDVTLSENPENPRNPAEQLEALVVPQLDLSRSSSDQESLRGSRNFPPGGISLLSPKLIESATDKALRQSELCNITTRSCRTQSDDELTEALRKQLCSEILSSRHLKSGSRKAQKESDPTLQSNQQGTPNTGSLGTYSGKDSTIIEVPTGIRKNEITSSSGFSFERGHKEREMSSMENRTAVDGSLLGCIAQPVSQSTPGLFSEVLRATVQPPYRKLTPIEFNPEATLPTEDVPHSRSSKLLASAINTDLTEASSPMTYKDSLNACLKKTRKIQSLPTLNYMEKVGAWNVTQYTGQTFFDNLALKGFTGVSPKKKAFNAIADSLNNIFTQQRSEKSPTPSAFIVSNHSPRRTLAASFSGTSSPANDACGPTGGLKSSPIGRSMSYTSLSTASKEIQQAGASQSEKKEAFQAEVVHGMGCASATTGANRSLDQDSSSQIHKASGNSPHPNDRKSIPNSSNIQPQPTTVLLEKCSPLDEEKSPEEGRKPGNQELQSSAQPPSLISLDRFSDLSPNHNFSSTLASSQDTSCYGDRRRLASARAVSASSIVSLEVDNYAPYWVTNPSTPAKNKDLNIEERIPVYLHNLGIDQSPSTILNPFLASGPIREPEFSPTDLRTIKGSTGTPTRSTQPSEELSVQNVAGSSSDRPVSQCSLQAAFHPLDRSLDLPVQLTYDDRTDCISAETFSLPEDRNQPLNESSLSRVAKHIRKFQSCELSVTPVSLSSTSLADDEHHTKTHEADNEEFAKVTDATPTRSLELGNDSFVGSKTLQEIRKLLGKADSLVSGRSSFSSPFASLRGSVNLASFLHNKSDSFQDYFSSSTENQQSLLSLLWKRSSSDSMLTLDGLRDDSFQGEIQPSKTPVTRSAIMTDHDRFSIDRNSVGNASKQITQESTRSSFPDKNVGRSEPEGCSEGTQDKVTPVLFPTVSSTEESQEERQGHIDLIQDVTSPKPKGSAVIGSVKESQTSDGKEGEKAMASDNSSVDSLAARVACVLKNESPATVASSVISEGDQEECKAQDWIKLKVAGQHHEPLELNVEDRQRIEEIKAELLLNTTGRKGQWSTDTDSDATSSLGLPEVQPSGKPAEELFALHTAKHQISSQMQKLTSNPFDTSVELHTPLRKDMDARIREREEHPRPSATQQLAYEVRKPIASITFSSRKRSPSPSACPTGLLTPASEFFCHTDLIQQENQQPPSMGPTELDQRQADSLPAMTITLPESQEHANIQKVVFSHQIPVAETAPRGYSDSHVQDIFSEAERDALTNRHFVPTIKSISKSYEQLRRNNLTGQDEYDSVSDLGPIKDILASNSATGYGFCHPQLGPDAHEELKLKLSAACSKRTEKEQQGISVTTDDTLPAILPDVRDHSPGRNFQMDAAKKRQASRSASNLTLEGNASASLENSAALLQISSFASGIPSVSSPTKKVLSYVHVTLSPKDPDGKSKSIEEKEFQFDSSLPRNEDGGAEMYQGRTGTLPAFPRLDPSGNPSEEKAQFPFQGHLSPDAAVSEEASNVRERRAADISKPLLEQGGSCEGHEPFTQQDSETQPVKPSYADASGQITTCIHSQLTRPSSSRLPKFRTSPQPSRGPSRPLHVQTSDPPMLLPYKPHGSPEIFYMPNTGGQVSTILSDTTMESSHTGSDDAVPPKFTVEIVGSKNKEVDIDEGIYIKRTQPRTVWKENKGRAQKEEAHQTHPRPSPEYPVPMEGRDHGHLNRESAAKSSCISFSGTTSKHSEHRRGEREFSRENLAFRKKQESDEFASLKGEVEYSIEDLHVHCSLVGEHPTSSTAARSMTTRENSSYGSPAQLGYERTLDPGFQVSTNDSLQGSRTLDELWEKFKEKRSCSEPQNYSGSALPLLERLDRLSRLLHNSSHHSFTPGRQNEQSGSRVHGLQSSKNDEVKGRLRENGDRHFREALREMSADPEEMLTSILTKHSITLSSSSQEPGRGMASFSHHLYPAEREQEDSVPSEAVSEVDTAIQKDSTDNSHIETGSTISTIDTARLVRAFGHRRVTVKPGLRKLYHTIDKQKGNLEMKRTSKQRESQRQKYRSAESPLLCRTESTRTLDSVSSTSTYSLPAQQGQSNTLKKKAVKLVSKGIQAGDLEIVNSGTKRHTRDVGMTFPSPGFSRGVQTAASRMGTKRDEHNESALQSFFNENKTRKSNLQQHPRGLSWFVPVDDLKSNAKKENQPGSRSGPGPVWFEPYTKNKPWREPLREKHVQEQPVSIRGRSMVQPITAPETNGKPPTSLIHRTLQEALQMRHPEFVSRSRERLKRLELLAEERRMQAVFDSEREDLFNRPGTKKTWRASHPDRLHGEENLLQKKKDIPKKEMFMRSKLKYTQLPEVLLRREEERRKAEYRSYRLKAELFQRKVTSRILGRKTLWQ